MFNKILIANRGEIAVRVIRACRELGIKAVAVYSEADRDSLHVRYADEAYCIGPPQPTESYLNIQNIIEVAEKSGAEAIHPGYGFLSQIPEFAEACEKAGIKFIGPTAESLRMMGDKARARKIMLDAGIPIIPGSLGPVKDENEVLRFAEKIGYPILVKAVYGGGGRGMRIIYNEEEAQKAVEIAKMEAETSFGSSSLYVEKWLIKPRHIEFQILADQHGNTIHLGERECSIQRKYQKLIEETPSPVVDEEKRKEIGELAVKAAEAAKYINAGTVEFLRDQQGNFYFLEMNTRLQVEHLITEMVTGIDIVKWQIRIAADEPLDVAQEEVEMRGTAIDCRINAEDPRRDFMPCPGTVSRFHPPGGPGVRVDTALYTGYTIPVYYDSLIAKLAVWGADRTEAIRRMQNALNEMVIEGVETTIPLLKGIIGHPDFQKAQIHVQFVDEKLRELLPAEAGPTPEELAALAVVVATKLGGRRATPTINRVQASAAGVSMWKAYGRWRLLQFRFMRGWA